jgi:hypothetical protein
MIPNGLEGFWIRPSFKDLFCRAVPNPSLTIRHFFIAVQQLEANAGRWALGAGEKGKRALRELCEQVRFCRYRFSAADELKYRGARRVRTQCPLYKRSLIVNYKIVLLTYRISFLN